MRALAIALVLSIAAAVTGCGAGSDDVVDIDGIGPTRIDVPRPTGAASAPCDADPLPEASSESIAERVAALRSIGLFAGRSSESTDEIATDIRAAIDDTWGELPDDVLPLLDLMVAEQDRERVWWRDLEADVADGNHVYESAIGELAAISVAELRVIEVAETWESSAGPVTVTVTLDDAAIELHPALVEDWIDPGILVDLNMAMGDDGRRFEMYKAFDQTAFVMALTDEDRTALEGRGWCFE